MKKVLILLFCLAVLNLFYFGLYEYLQKLINAHSIAADLIIIVNIAVSALAAVAAILLRRKKPFIASLSVALVSTAIVWAIIYNGLECDQCIA